MDKLALPFQFKSIDATGHVEGLAAAFGNVDFGGDRIMPGAFAKTLANRGGEPVPMLLHHSLSRPVGAWTDLTETATGLEAKGKITLAARDGAEAHALAGDGALRGLSIGYRATRHVMKGAVRELHEVVLHEVSLVAVPLNERTILHTVKAIAAVGDIRDLFQEAGLSGRQAKAAAGAAWKAINDASHEDEADAALAAILNNSVTRIAGRRTE